MYAGGKETVTPQILAHVAAEAIDSRYVWHAISTGLVDEGVWNALINTCIP